MFDLAIARTGLREAEARDAGFDPVTSEVKAWDHKAYYPGAHEMHLRVTGDRRTGRLLGAQIVGHWQAQVAKRVDIFAAALFAGMTVDEINDLDLSYTPPLSSPGIASRSPRKSGVRLSWRSPGQANSSGNFIKAELASVRRPRPQVDAG